MTALVTQGFPATTLLELKGLQQKSSATERGALAISTVSPLEVKLAIAIVLVSLLAFAAAVPFANVPLLPITAFIPSYESALAINDFVTAILLLGRGDRRGSRATLVLGCGYLFNTIIIVVHALSFPGVFSKTGLLGANDQTTAWLYVFWHGGFPLFVLAYALLSPREKASGFLLKYPGWTIAFSTTGVLAIVALCLWLATAGHHLLPRIVNGGDFRFCSRRVPARSFWH